MHLVHSKLNDKKYAIKTLYFNAIDTSEVLDVPVDQYFMREVEAQQRVRSPYVLSVEAGNWGLTGMFSSCGSNVIWGLLSSHVVCAFRISRLDLDEILSEWLFAWTDQKGN